MAVTATHLLTGGDSTDSTSYTTASITPAANTLILVWVYTIAASAVVEPTASGNGLTWVKVGTQVDDDGVRRITLFRAMGSSPTAGGITFDFGAQTQTGGGWSITQFSGVDTTGTNGSGAVVQFASAMTAGIAEGLTITLAAFSSPDNAAAGGFGYPLNQVDSFNVGAGFTLLGRINQAGPNLSIGTEWKASNDTTVDANASPYSVPWAGVAVEIKAAPSTVNGIKVYIGGIATVKPVKVASGGIFTQKPLKRYNAATSTWVAVEY